MQDSTINGALRQIHRECMNGRHDGLEHVVALLRLRGVKPDFKKLAGKSGPGMRQRRLAKLRAARLQAEQPADTQHDERP